MAELKMRRIGLVAALTCLALFLSDRQIAAQTYGAIQTDRPDVTESATTVQKYRLQVESGFEYHQDKQKSGDTGQDFQTINIANTLLRYGMTKKWELRLGALYTTQTIKKSGSKNSQDGIHGLAIGAKYWLVRETGRIPNVAVIAAADLPLGNKQFAPDKLTPNVVFCAAHTLGERYSFGYNLGSSFEDQDHFLYHYSASLGLNMSEELSAFAEVFGDFSQNNIPENMVDGGFAYRLQRNLQVDFSAGKALNGNAADWFVNAGFAARLPK
jgi:hypothetical protein